MKIIFADYAWSGGEGEDAYEPTEFLETDDINFLTEKIIETYNSHSVDVYYVGQNNKIYPLCHDDMGIYYGADKEETALFDYNNDQKKDEDFVVLNKNKLKKRLKNLEKQLKNA